MASLHWDLNGQKKNWVHIYLLTLPLFLFLSSSPPALAAPSVCVSLMFVWFLGAMVCIFVFIIIDFYLLIFVSFIITDHMLVLAS